MPKEPSFCHSFRVHDISSCISCCLGKGSITTGFFDDKNLRSECAKNEVSLRSECCKNSIRMLSALQSESGQTSAQIFSGRAGKAILKISIFWPKIILKISKSVQIEVV